MTFWDDGGRPDEIQGAPEPVAALTSSHQRLRNAALCGDRDYNSSIYQVSIYPMAMVRVLNKFP